MNTATALPLIGAALSSHSVFSLAREHAVVKARAADSD